MCFNCSSVQFLNCWTLLRQHEDSILIQRKPFYNVGAVQCVCYRLTVIVRDIGHAVPMIKSVYTNDDFMTNT